MVNGQRSTVNCQRTVPLTPSPSPPHPLSSSPPHPLIPSSPWPGKVEPALAWEVLAAHTAGLIALTGCRRGPVAAPLLRGDEPAARAALYRLLDLFGRKQLFVEVQHHGLPDDDRLVRRLLRLVHGTGVPVVATHNAHYATRERSMARDVLIATRHNMTLLAARAPATCRSTATTRCPHQPPWRAASPRAQTLSPPPSPSPSAAMSRSTSRRSDYLFLR